LVCLWGCLVRAKLPKKKPPKKKQQQHPKNQHTTQIPKKNQKIKPQNRGGVCVGVWGGGGFETTTHQQNKTPQKPKKTPNKKTPRGFGGGGVGVGGGGFPLTPHVLLSPYYILKLVLFPSIQDESPDFFLPMDFLLLPIVSFYCG